MGTEVMIVMLIVVMMGLCYDCGDAGAMLWYAKVPKCVIGFMTLMVMLIMDDDDHDDE